MILRTRDTLRAHGGHGDFSKCFGIVGVYFFAQAFENFPSLIRRLPVAFNDNGRVNILVEKLLRLVQQFAGQNYSGSSSIAYLVVLCLGDFDEHLSRWVLDV